MAKKSCLSTSLKLWTAKILYSSNFFSLLQWDNIQRWIKRQYVILTRIVSLKGTVRGTVIKSCMYQQKILIQWLCDHCIDPLCNVKWHKVSNKEFHCFYIIFLNAYMYVLMPMCVLMLVCVCAHTCMCSGAHACMCVIVPVGTRGQLKVSFSRTLPLSLRQCLFLA